MKKILYVILLLVLGNWMFSSCYKDEGNYDYHEINEVTIGDMGFVDTTYNVTAFVDTIKIKPEISKPEISFKLGDNNNLIYEWKMISANVGNRKEYDLGNAAELNYPVALSAGNYTLYLKITDTVNTVEYLKMVGVIVQNVQSSGWVVLGENDEGFIQMDMVSIVKDTTILKDIIKDSGLPPLKKPVNLWVADYHSKNMIHISTEEGTYLLDRKNLVGGEQTNFKYSFYDPTVVDEFVLKDAIQVRNYQRYEWKMISANVGNRKEYDLGNAAELNYPVALSAGNYTLYLKITDTVNTVEYLKMVGMIVQNIQSSGWVVLGENDEGFIQMDMVSTVRDTVILKNILKDSGLPPLKKPVNVWVIDHYANNMTHVSTEEGTYLIGRENFVGGEHTNYKYRFYDPTVVDEFILKDAIQVKNYQRIAIVGSNLFQIGDLNQGDNFGQPANHYKGNYDFFAVGDKIGANIKSGAQSFVVYNDKDKRFLKVGGSGMGSTNGYCDSLSDTRTDIGIFSWKPGLDYVTTINSRFLTGYTYTILKDTENSKYYLYRSDTRTDIGIFSWKPGLDYVTTINSRFLTGYTYTILKDTENSKYYLYSYCIDRPVWGTGNSFVKKGKYELVNCPEFENARFFGASALRTFLIYATDSKLYAYDFQSGKSKLIKDFGTHEITCMHYDLIFETSSDCFYVAYATDSKLYAYDFQSGKSKLIKDFGTHEITCMHYDLIFETSSDCFYVASYDPSLPASTGGTITKFKVNNDPNDISIEAIPESTWTGLCKIKSIQYKRRYGF